MHVDLVIEHVSCMLFFLSMFIVCFSVLSSHKADVNGTKLNFEMVGTGNKHVLMCPGALGEDTLVIGGLL